MQTEFLQRRRILEARQRRVDRALNRRIDRRARIEIVAIERVQTVDVQQIREPAARQIDVLLFDVVASPTPDVLRDGRMSRGGCSSAASRSAGRNDAGTRQHAHVAVGQRFEIGRALAEIIRGPPRRNDQAQRLLERRGAPSGSRLGRDELAIDRVEVLAVPRLQAVTEADDFALFRPPGQRQRVDVVEHQLAARLLVVDAVADRSARSPTPSDAAFRRSSRCGRPASV